MAFSLADNPLRTRADLERAAVSMIEPLIPLMSRGKARLHLGETGAVFTASIAGMEGFSRILWAIVPMLAGRCEGVRSLWPLWREGIIHGVDPEDPEYWGTVGDYDQRLVEMAVMGMGMAVAPDAFFFDLPEKTQRQLWSWLDQINRYDMPKNNWTFFRVLVNMGFRVCGLPWDEERTAKDFALIEEHYDGDGWYFDYLRQREYYSIWAFGYYEIVYAYVMRGLDPERSRVYLERAEKMAVDFACWFDANGEAIPYGRSLTYRFAQGAFYSALALVSDRVTSVSPGVMKHLMLNNFRRWLKSPIFTRDGVLTIGYHYPDLVMAEGYNSPGSPYWAFKIFAALMLPEDHPFWQAEEEATEVPSVSLQEHMRMLIVRSGTGRHVMAFTAGNHADEHTHAESKYEKFVYSTCFGFSVSRSMKLLHEGAFDSMLALSPDGGVTFQPRYGCDSFELTERSVCCVWSPFPGTTVETDLVPCGEWHLRRHVVRTDRPLVAAEGGYAVSRDHRPEFDCADGALGTQTSSLSAKAFAPWGVSGIRAVQGFDEARIVYPEPNTNLMAPRTALPTLLAHLPAGETTLVSLVYGSPDGDAGTFDTPPKEVLDLGQMDR